MHNVDAGRRDAQLVGHDLRKHRLVALPMAVRPGHHADVAGGIDPHGRRVEQADAGTQHAHKVRRGNAAGLDPG